MKQLLPSMSALLPPMYIPPPLAAELFLEVVEPLKCSVPRTIYIYYDIIWIPVACATTHYIRQTLLSSLEEGLGTRLVIILLYAVVHTYSSPPQKSCRPLTFFSAAAPLRNCNSQLELETRSLSIPEANVSTVHIRNYYSRLILTWHLIRFSPHQHCRQECSCGSVRVEFNTPDPSLLSPFSPRPLGRV